MSIPLHLLYDKVKFQLRYVDYAEDTWTVPVILTEERADKFCQDMSVVQVKILTDKQEWILDLKN